MQTNRILRFELILSISVSPPTPPLPLDTLSHPLTPPIPSPHPPSINPPSPPFNPPFPPLSPLPLSPLPLFPLSSVLSHAPPSLTLVFSLPSVLHSYPSITHLPLSPLSRRCLLFPLSSVLRCHMRGVDHGTLRHESVVTFGTEGEGTEHDMTT